MTKLVLLILMIFLQHVHIQTSAATNRGQPDDLDAAFESHQRGDFERAIKSYKKAIKMLESTISKSNQGRQIGSLCTALHNLGFILNYEKRRHDEAVKYLKRATGLNPSYFEAYHHLGQVTVPSFNTVESCFVTSNQPTPIAGVQLPRAPPGGCRAICS
jgi:tetratricopeptide (TPR) repeat protein